MGTGSFPGVKYGRGVLLTTQPLRMPWSWKSRAIPLPTLWATTGPVTGTLYLFTVIEFWWQFLTLCVTHAYWYFRRRFNTSDAACTLSCLFILQSPLFFRTITKITEPSYCWLRLNEAFPTSVQKLACFICRIVENSMWSCARRMLHSAGSCINPLAPDFFLFWHTLYIKCE